MICPRMFAKILACLGLLFLLANCASQKSMDGAYRGPEKFGKEEYTVNPPPAELGKKVRVVLLTFKDERAKHPELDWTRQANIHADSIGQPSEVRPEIEKAMLSGLRKHPGIVLVPSQQFLKNREADVVISGRVVKCEAERGARVFGAQTVLEITLRDEFGNLFWKAPITVQEFGKAAYRDTGYFDEIDPGKVGAALTESIERAVNSLLQKPALRLALERAQGGPNREMMTKDFNARNVASEVGE